MKIYLVSTGSYSDYSVVAAFSRAEDALAAAEKLDDGASFEMELDDCIDFARCGLFPFLVEMTIEGEIIHAKQNRFVVIGEDTAKTEFNTWPPLEKPQWQSEDSLINKLPWCECETWAKDEEHAIKICNEFRTRAIALDRWRKTENEEQLPV